MEKYENQILENSDSNDNVVKNNKKYQEMTSNALNSWQTTVSISWWWIWMLASSRILSDLKEKWIDPWLIVWTSWWSIVWALLATWNLNLETERFFRSWLENSDNISQDLPYIIIAKLLPFLVEWIDESSNLIDIKEDLMLRNNDIYNRLKYYKIEDIIKNWSINDNILLTIINSVLDNPIHKIRKISFLDIKRNFWKNFRVVIWKINMKNIFRKWRKVRDNIVFRWSFSVLDAVLFSSYFSWNNKIRLWKKLIWWFVDSYFTKAGFLAEERFVRELSEKWEQDWIKKKDLSDESWNKKPFRILISTFNNHWMNLWKIWRFFLPNSFSKQKWNWWNWRHEIWQFSAIVIPPIDDESLNACFTPKVWIPKAEKWANKIIKDTQ